MNKFAILILAILCFTNTSKAGLIEDYGFKVNDNYITDTNTQLNWRYVDQSINYNNYESYTNNGGILEGWRLATELDLLNLLSIHDPGSFYLNDNNIAVVPSINYWLYANSGFESYQGSPFWNDFFTNLLYGSVQDLSAPISHALVLSDIASNTVDTYYTSIYGYSDDRVAYNIRHAALPVNSSIGFMIQDNVSVNEPPLFMLLVASLLTLLVSRKTTKQPS